MIETSMAKTRAHLCLVHSRSMSQVEVDRRFELATVYLSDSRARGFSARGRFGAAYGAARQCALAFAGASDAQIVYGKRHRETFRYLTDSLALDAKVARTSDEMVSLHYLEEHLFYEGSTAVSEPIVLRAVEWAAQLIGATTSAVRQRSGSESR